MRGKKHTDAKPIEETIEEDVKNFTHHIWAHTKPVLHLAMMLKGLVVQSDITTMPPQQYFDFEWCVRNPDLWLLRIEFG